MGCRNCSLLVFQVFFYVACLAFTISSAYVIQHNRKNSWYWLLTLLCLFLMWQPIVALFIFMRRKNLYEARLLLPEVGHGMQVLKFQQKFKFDLSTDNFHSNYGITDVRC
jgi:hypothetical protein